jgi:hypothetical protein
MSSAEITRRAGQHLRRPLHPLVSRVLAVTLPLKGNRLSRLSWGEPVTYLLGLPVGSDSDDVIVFEVDRNEVPDDLISSCLSRPEWRC